MIFVSYYLFKAVTRLEQEHQAGTLVLERDFPQYGVKPAA
jgi:hypothetical protein